jgi:hypothetical protein
MVIKYHPNIESILKKGKDIKLSKKEIELTKGKIILERNFFEGAHTRTRTKQNTEFTIDKGCIGKGVEKKAILIESIEKDKN